MVFFGVSVIIVTLAICNTHTANILTLTLNVELSAIYSFTVNAA